MLADMIKEYLVGIGFRVDTQALGRVSSSMQEAENIVSRFAGTSVTSFAVAGTAVISFVAIANAGIAKFMEGLAKADLENEKFARRMWTSKDNAMAYKNSLDAMGATMEDLFLSPEQMQNYFKLRDQAMAMGAPKEYAEAMKTIRSVMFEFQRMKLEATYAMQWIGYYLFKYLEKPLGNAKLGLKGINDAIVKTMPTWTKIIAQVLSWFVRLGIAAVDVGKGLLRLFNALPKSIVAVGTAIAVVMRAMQMGPLGWIMAAITAVLLLMDDFTTYQAGGESMFGDVWKQVEGFANSPAWEDIKKGLDELGKTALQTGGKVWDLMINIGKLVDSMSKAAGFSNGMEAALWLLEKPLKVISVLIDGLNSSIIIFKAGMETIGALSKGDFKGIAKIGKEAQSELEKTNVGKFGKSAGEKVRAGGLQGWAEDLFGHKSEREIGENFFNKMQSEQQKNQPGGTYNTQIAPGSTPYTIPQKSNVTTNINIYGNGDPVAVGNSVNDRMDSIMSRYMGGGR